MTRATVATTCRQRGPVNPTPKIAAHGTERALLAMLSRSVDIEGQCLAARSTTADPSPSTWRWWRPSLGGDAGSASNGLTLPRA
eukprot:scaffold69942_cov87-Phaeocystis_antarctica.AAC.6